ncbi:patatin-like phospholipase family protein [Ohtaekwangia koreensis]|uniref:Patatin-like phospholipase n=1 Tax=Ohtaekwangia koreensis TaxID=688867 RepID=A0A1T5MNK8_9BACT|nr:patatin-like phospholipase family protein [Ohtaekwangia koreensis]SKC89795.1 Patatin-like phospholipase [Ohtaekwangia koreensis]
MLRKLYLLGPKFIYSFPVQLLFNNIKRNQVLMLCWIILFAMITGSFGKYLGIPYLFLDPEYLNHVNFRSFFILGLVTAGFTTAFHITCYITDGHRFSFVGTLSKPFSKFAINNSVIPAIFLITYIYEIIEFQTHNEYSTPAGLAWNLGGLLTGYTVMTLIFFGYFWLTNKDIFKYVVCRIDEKIKQNVQVTRASAMKKLDIARKKQVRVDNYIDYDLKVKEVEYNTFYDKATVLQVFDQNHFNLVVIELMIFIIIIVLGIFKDYPMFQLPAASSFIIFLTVFVMMSGAFSYWFGGWSATVALLAFLTLNYLVGEEFFTKKYEAFGLDYQRMPAEYTIQALQQLNDSAHIQRDKQATMVMLENWRKKFPADQKPKMVFLCTSGGGKRAALWTLTALQASDSLTKGKLMENTILITGASGGLIGASYYRELKLQAKKGKNIHPNAMIHRQKIATDNLNPLIFSLMANDLFVGFTKFEYGGNLYYRDRGYTFEEQLNQITENLLNKPIEAYDIEEKNAVIPMMILTPTVVNDGRKLYIAASPVSFMNYDITDFPRQAFPKISGVDFQTLFKDHNGANLRFLSALRMSATFPYITPNTTLPTEPGIKIMDAGISDNFGVSDAVRFLFAFKEWIGENTSGIVFVSIRDSPKLDPIKQKTGQTIIDDFTQPISSVYNNFENFQDINSDMLIGHAKSWFKGDIDRIDLQYQTENYVPILQKMDSIRQNNSRASLSWRLTTREKYSIEYTINSAENQRQLQRLVKLLENQN